MAEKTHLDNAIERASRSRVAAAATHRGQVARLIAVDAEGHVWPGPGAMQNPGRLRQSAILSGATFDVHAVFMAVSVMLDEVIKDGERLTLSWRVRLAQRVLDALEGQPSECGHWTANDGQTMKTTIVDHVPTVMPCGCQGTGHNLRGRLPPLRPSAQLCRRRADQGVDGFTGLRTTGPTWLDDPETTGYMAPGWGLGPTRVAPRGEHRRPLTSPRWPDQWRGWSLDERITARGRFDTTPRSRQPRWQLGEQRHADQRRAKA